MNAIENAPTGEDHKVFICYRREDTAAHAGRLYDAMLARFGEGNVFMDVDMPPGVDFVERITEVVSGCLALIVVMGPNWVKTADGEGRRRIEDPADFVRLEVETALGRSDVTVIPTLVAGAKMPHHEELPSELRPIARRNALELSDARWGYDVGRLVDTLDGLLGLPSGSEHELEPEPEPEPRPRVGPRLVLEGALLAGLTAAGVRALRYLGREPSDDHRGEDLIETAVKIANTTLIRTVVLAAVGVVVALLLAGRLRHAEVGPVLRRGLWLGALAGVLGGLVWAVPVYAPSSKVVFDDKALIELAGIAVSGGVIGALVGGLWRPPRVGPGILAGAAGGFVFQLIVVVRGWENNDPRPEVVLSYGLGAAAIVGAAIATMIVLDRGWLGGGGEGSVARGAETR